MVKSTVVNPLGGISSSNVVPQLTKKIDVAVDDDDFNLVELDPKKQYQEDIQPSLSELKNIDPFLVFLCYRGFNHISGKVQNGR